MTDELDNQRHGWIYHTAPMRCGTCGLDSRACACSPDELRSMSCSTCGCRFLTGGPSLIDLLRLEPERPS